VKFIDEAVIVVEAGDGGDGCTAFRREAHVARGGPSGGDGGRGGSVIIKADVQMDTLLDHTYKRRYRAKRGGHGSGRNCTGAGGEDLIIPVPVGTQVIDVERGDLLADLTEPNQEMVAARGGRGGFGNARFATPTNRAPRRSDPGSPGEQRQIKLVLKLMAEVGLVGMPNVGKSTFLSVISRARPKIANYPFTTLNPHLGIADLTDGRALCVADIPGLVQGASEGRGLGIRFLKHLERTKVFLHLVSVFPEEDRDPVEDWLVLKDELKNYPGDLDERTELVVMTKTDLPYVREALEDTEKRFAEKGVKLMSMSAVLRKGVREILEELYDVVSNKRDPLKGRSA